MLNKNNQKINLWKYTLVVPLTFFFMLFQVNVGAEKAKETTLNITGMKVELQITSNSTERIKC
jgi:hypothetical protein